MKHLKYSPTRRSFLAASASGSAALAMGGLQVPCAYAAGGFPDHNMNVSIATRQGGAADRLSRTFCEVWKKHIGADFTFDFYPGASGEVGYEIFLDKKKHDGYNLLFASMGPETILYAERKLPYSYPRDYIYFCQVDVDDGVIFVPKNSPYKDLQHLVDDAKKKTVNVATSRLPDPVTIGMLALADATKAKFNIVPYGGGNPTETAVVTGEVPVGILVASNIIRLGDRVRTIGVFSNENKLSAQLDNAPSVNKVFGTHIPDLPLSHAWTIQTDVLTRYPDRFKKIEETAKAVFIDPDYKTVYEKTKAPWSEIQYGDREACRTYAEHMLELAKRYRSAIVGKKT